MKEKYLRKRFGDSLTCKNCGEDPFKSMTWFNKTFMGYEKKLTFVYEEIMKGEMGITTTCATCGEVGDISKSDLSSNISSE